ncbi:MAG TPA: MarR family transcriptional regulator [Burkholderiales bacterium]|nr:MarR family transcriptional regulator [Burkholderiales bacterium]
MSNSLERKQSRPAAPPASAPGDELDHGTLPDLLGYQLRLAQLAVFRDFGATAGDLGASPGRFGMLVLIEANPGVTQSRLARAVGLDRSTMVAVLDQLEGRGFLERRQGEDRRTNGLWLTKEGRALLAKMKPRVSAHEDRIAHRLSEEERRTLLALLARLNG